MTVPLERVHQRDDHHRHHHDMDPDRQNHAHRHGPFFHSLHHVPDHHHAHG